MDKLREALTANLPSGCRHPEVVFVKDSESLTTYVIDDNLGKMYAITIKEI